MGLKVIDLYCGAGGFSEGFRQVGFEIKAGFDNWKDARTTFQKNFPEALVPDERVDIPRNKRRIVNLVREEIGHVDVIIGGPPCVEFSSSKNAGKGNIDAGLQHVKAFFDIVRNLKPEYWVMENVPRIRTFLDASIKEGRLKPPAGREAWVFDSQYHNVPQARRRVFTGGFPGGIVEEWEEYRKKRGNVIPVSKIIGGLPDCYMNPGNGFVQDPLYATLKLEEKSLTDHLEYGRILRLTSWEERKNRDLKLHHPYCGRMRFPEDLDRPARTVMATQFSVSRESMVLKDPNGRNYLRLPTPRECACMQGFPLNYQFWGNSPGTRYKLVGNAVPVGLARDIAKSILHDTGLKVPRKPRVTTRRTEMSPHLNLQPRKKHVLQGPFRWHPIGSLIKGSRVDLDNTQRYNEEGKRSLVTRNVRHNCRWDAVLHVGIGRPRWRHSLVDSEAILETLGIADMGKKREEKLLSSVRSLHGTVPDATSLFQAHRTPSRRTWKKSQNGVIRPRALLDEVDSIRRGIVRSRNKFVDCKDIISIAPKTGIPLITLVSAFIVYWMCREINDCNRWMIENSERRYIPAGWEGRGNPSKEKCRGVMSKSFPERV
jgi:DNA (cytosine-5)-methyltransferase 1